MRTTLRLGIALVVCALFIAFVFAFVDVRTEKQRMTREMESRAQLVAESMEESVEDRLAGGQSEALRQTVERLGNRLSAVAIYDIHGKLLAITAKTAWQLTTAPAVVRQTILQNRGRGEFIELSHTPVYAFAIPLHGQGQVVGALAVFDDASEIATQSSELWRPTYLRLVVQTLIILLLALLIVRWSVVVPIAKTAQWLRELRSGNAPEGKLNPPPEELFKPLTQEVTHIVKSLAAARAVAEEEARLREAGESLWTSERLRAHVSGLLQGNSLFVVSNREPFMHVRKGKSVEVMVPASGLVTSLEPVLQACDGTWIAHGAGDADREAVDKHDRLRVPPEEPHYTLRRVWLTQEEEEGYYFGFSNEGLWPLCHIAHTRPAFRASDWNYYQQVNRRFADAVLEEMADAEQPAALVQDFHFALLPRMIKEKRPDARVAVFWHIPWPNPQAFGICPWQRDLLDGLLGADLLGFHVQSHCNYFLETVDQALESHIDWERFAVTRRGHVALVRPFPISVAGPEALPEGGKSRSVYLERAALFKSLGVQATFMGVGVDRVDYTKGILERFFGVERVLEKYPSYQGQFTLVQIGAPSRTRIKRYHDLMGELQLEAERINRRFQTSSWKPIVFLDRHHTHQEIDQYYRAADLCLVTSLDDGMNLVAKEFVTSRDDEQGVLILSGFTGAARELRDALLVNPYDIEQLAEAIRIALEMDPGERKARLERMRRIVKEHNIYRWAANLITELSEIRIEKREKLPLR